MSAVLQDPGRFGSGKNVLRVEDPALLAGKGQFTDDLVVPGQTYLAFLRSPFAHARILSVDTAAARAMPGVLAVLTGAELAQAGVKPIPPVAGFPGPGGRPPASAAQRALAT